MQKSSSFTVSCLLCTFFTFKLIAFYSLMQKRLTTIHISPLIFALKQKTCLKTQKIQSDDSKFFVVKQHANSIKSSAEAAICDLRSQNEGLTQNYRKTKDCTQDTVVTYLKRGLKAGRLLLTVKILKMKTQRCIGQ